MHLIAHSVDPMARGMRPTAYCCALDSSWYASDSSLVCVRQLIGMHLIAHGMLSIAHDMHPMAHGMHPMVHGMRPTAYWYAFDSSWSASDSS
jgi:hypothetical protein